MQIIDSTPVKGISYTRSGSILVKNPLNGTPSIHFQREKIVELDSGDITTSTLPEISADFTDPSTAIPLVHPETGESLGEGSYGQLQVLLYSLYISLLPTE